MLKKGNNVKIVPTRDHGLQLFGRDGWHPIARIRNEFDRMFDGPLSTAMSGDLMRPLRGATEPALELRDNENEYELVAELPGIDSEDIEIKVTDGMLRLSGEKSEDKEEQENGFLFSERSYGWFERSMKLPDGVDYDKITADSENGLLKVHIPKSAEARQHERKISINAS